MSAAFVSALLDGDGGAHDIGPAGVLEADGLDALARWRTTSTPLASQIFLASSMRVDAVLLQHGVDLGDSSLVAFKQCHGRFPPYSCRGSMMLGGFVEAPVGAGGLLQGLVGVHALLDRVHHLAEIDELVADDLVVLVERRCG